MKKMAWVCAALLAVAGFAASAAQAQMCFKWVVFCDGIQVDEVADTFIRSQWYHWDCANNVPMTHGRTLRSTVQNECPGGNGTARIACQQADGCEAGDGDWFFVIDTLDGTMDMNMGGPDQASCWIDELQYTLTLGACTGAPQHGTRPPVSTVH